MNKSELKQLIREAIMEMDDPYRGVTFDKTVTRVSPTVKPVLDKASQQLQTLFRELTKVATTAYGAQFSDIGVSLKIDHDGVPDIQIYGRNKNTGRHGGNLDVRTRR